MKYFIIFSLLIGNISSLIKTEEKSEDRPISVIIIDAIYAIRDHLRNSGVDPLVVKQDQIELALPVASVFRAYGLAENITILGLSNIVVNNVNHSDLRINFDLLMPGIHLNIGRAYGEVTSFGRKADGTISGRVDIGATRAIGYAQLSFDLNKGVAVDEFIIHLNFQGIDSDLKKVEIFNYILTERTNTFLGITLPEILCEYKEDINSLLQQLLKEMFNNLISRVSPTQYQNTLLP